ncbi:hypothetical protein Mapa_002011 [Marchantia paleacea]|nr:hypothetical protein Mapa_002011 [Marchantia paleacea]
MVIIPAIQSTRHEAHRLKSFDVAAVIRHTCNQAILESGRCEYKNNMTEQWNPRWKTRIIASCETSSTSRGAQLFTSAQSNIPIIRHSNLRSTRLSRPKLRVPLQLRSTRLSCTKLRVPQDVKI